MSTMSTYVIAITPFGADGSIDDLAVRAHLRRMSAAGVGAYVGGGGSGEGFTLSDPEMQHLLEVAVDELGGGVRAMGIEPRTAQQMIDFVRVAARVGVEACQVYSLDPGHGHRPTTKEVEVYLDTVLDACDVPAVISTHQSVGYRIAPDLLARVVERHEQVIGVNCSHADLTYLAALVDALGSGIEICVGGPLQALSAIGVGAHGYLSSEANLTPRLAASLVHAAEADDLPMLLERYGILARMHGVLYGAGGIRMTTAILARLGLPGGGIPRLPQLAPTEEATDAVMARLAEWGVPEIEGW